MLTIWKYVLAGTGEQTIRLPKGAQLLSAHSQFDAPCLWALVDASKDAINRRIMMYGTGHAVDEALPFVGTVLMNDAALVFHVFDGGEVE